MQLFVQLCMQGHVLGYIFLHLVFYCICVHCTKTSLFQLSDIKNSHADDEHIQILATVILAGTDLSARMQTVESCGLCIFVMEPSTRRMNSEPP